MQTLESRLKDFVGSASSRLPNPGGGATRQRLRSLSSWGKTDLSFARIAEAHADALAILAEGGLEARIGALYGVWASDAPPSRVVCERTEGDRWRVDGVKYFCSGAALVDAALVTAQHPEGIFLFDLPVRHPGVVAQPTAWASPAFADTTTTAVRFALVVPDAFRVGSADWYLSRPGFWHGAVSPAACWAGGAECLIEAAAAADLRDPHSRAQLGALQSIAWGLDAVLDRAGREIDADPADRAASARGRALKVRHLIERACAETLDRFGRATGPRLLAYDAQVARQYAALGLYIRQCHGERDLENISLMAERA